MLWCYQWNILYRFMLTINGTFFIVSCWLSVEHSSSFHADYQWTILHRFMLTINGTFFIVSCWLSMEHSSSFHADDQPWREDVKPTVFHWIAASSFFCLEPNQGGGERDCFCAVRNCSCTLVSPRCGNYKFLSRHCITAMRGTRDALADCRHRSIFVCLWLQSIT